MTNLRRWTAFHREDTVPTLLTVIAVLAGAVLGLSF